MFGIYFHKPSLSYLTELINNGADCRTAPATPGLLKMLNSFFMVETFKCHGELVHTLIDHVQLRQPLCFSASYLFSVLQLFTRLEDATCKSESTLVKNN